jgi:predicted Zn-ribbon and HTH transcriptional regulator
LLRYSSMNESESFKAFRARTPWSALDGSYIMQTQRLIFSWKTNIFKKKVIYLIMKLLQNYFSNCTQYGKSPPSLIYDKLSRNRKPGQRKQQEILIIWLLCKKCSFVHLTIYSSQLPTFSLAQISASDQCNAKFLVD